MLCFLGHLHFFTIFTHQPLWYHYLLLCFLGHLHFFTVFSHQPLRYHYLFVMPPRASPLLYNLHSSAIMISLFIVMLPRASPLLYNLLSSTIKISLFICYASSGISTSLQSSLINDYDIIINLLCILGHLHFFAIFSHQPLRYHYLFVMPPRASPLLYNFLSSAIKISLFICYASSGISTSLQSSLISH